MIPIANRMGYRSGASAVRLLMKQGFVMYRRRVHGRLCWYTNDDLIAHWEIAKAKVERGRIKEDGLYIENKNRGRLGSAAA